MNLVFFGIGILVGAVITSLVRACIELSNSNVEVATQLEEIKNSLANSNTSKSSRK